MSDRRPDPAAAVDAELCRAGHDPGCEDCLLALALNGKPACVAHYVPVPERGGR